MKNRQLNLIRKNLSTIPISQVRAFSENSKRYSKDGPTAPPISARYFSGYTQEIHEFLRSEIFINAQAVDELDRIIESNKEAIRAIYRSGGTTDIRPRITAILDNTEMDIEERDSCQKSLTVASAILEGGEAPIDGLGEG